MMAAFICGFVLGIVATVGVVLYKLSQCLPVQTKFGDPNA